ncbi:MAG: DUF4174 domain-containing protein [Bacteroidota bacterium]
MNVFLFISIFFLINICQAQEFKKFQWKKRIVLLLFDSNTKAQATKQLKLLETQSTQLEDRDIVVIGHHNTGKKNDLHYVRSLDIAKNYNGLVVLGKDGQVKMMKEFIVPPEKIFALIDGMPMRKMEMREKEGY